MRHLYRKFPSILNMRHSAEIAEWVKFHPWLKTARYVITEKIHGANAQMVIPAGAGDILVGTREIPMENKADDGFGVLDIPSRHESLIHGLKDYWTFRMADAIGVWGEIFGPGIQKGVCYSGRPKDAGGAPVRMFRIFGMSIDGRPLPMREVSECLDEIGCSGLLVPILGFADGLDAAMAFPHELPTTILPGFTHGDGRTNWAEGIVIEPWDRVCQSPLGQMFKLKHKHAIFDESGRPKAVKEKTGDPVVDDLSAKFSGYVNRNRIDCVCSKHGRIRTHADIGRYVRLILEDAAEDFAKEHPEFVSLDKGRKRRVMSAGDPVPHLYEMLGDKPI